MAAPADPPAFRARAPWWGGDLQTLRNNLAPGTGNLPGTSKRIFLALGDGSGDRIAAMLDSPAKAMDGPLIVLIHGLAGSEASAYLRTSSAFHLNRGRRVLRLNLRGAGPSRATCIGHYHAGCGQDLHHALAALAPDLAAPGFFIVGYSLGGNALLNLLASHDLPIRGAATVSAPIEPAQAAQRFMEPRNALYHHWLLRQMKQESTAPGALLSQAERAAIARARTIYQFDDGFIAPRNGFDSADDYYARTAGARMAGDIAVPTLMIHARDDPWIPPAAYDALMERAPDNIRIVLTEGGGHVGFHAQGHAETWHDRRIDAFLRSL
jgi:predicted alpha/beta-fold hydrolase